MNRHFLAAALMAGIFLLPLVAFGDAQIIDISCILAWVLDPESIYFIADPTPYVTSDVDWTAETGLGIPDVEDFKLLSLILANPSAPHHDEVHAGYATNANLARPAIGSVLNSYLTSFNESGPKARQPIPGTDPQQYYGAEGLLAAYILMGEWDLYIKFMEAFKSSAFGAPVVVPTSTDGYTLLDRLGMCADFDGDGVSNCSEYWAVSPWSWVNAINPLVADAGYGWNLWACGDTPDKNVRFWYNPPSQRVYFKTARPVTWAEALDFTLSYPGRADTPAVLCAIHNDQEMGLIYEIANSDAIWIGCTDAGRDIGHSAPNPQDWYWLSDPTQSPMSYRFWENNQPDGVDGAEDCGALPRAASWWQDVSEFTGDPPEPRRYTGVFELAGTFPDADANGAPDAFEDKDGDLLPDGFELPCPFAGALTAQGAAFHEAVMEAESIEPGLKDDVVALGVSDWSGWDIEGIENYPPDAPGDGLPDYAQAALIEYVACNEALDASSSMFAAMTTNKGLFESDVAALSATYPELATLATYKDLFAGLIGSSPEMKATVNAIILEMTGGGSGLPSLNEYVIFGSGGKGLPWFAGYGNFDGDDLTNAEEWAAVLAAGKGLDEFLLAATDPNNFWPGNPEIPVAGVIGAGLLAGTLLIAAAHALRRKQ